MPQYYFHVHNEDEAHDEEGREFADLNAAIASSILDVRALMGDDINETGTLNMSHSVEIATESGQQLHVTHYDDCVKIVPRELSTVDG